MTLAAPPLSAFGRSLQSASHHGVPRSSYAPRRAARAADHDRGAGRSVRWRYTHVLDGLAVVLPRSEVGAARRRAGCRARLAERTLPRAPHYRRAAADRCGQALGRQPRDGGQRDQDRDHRRRPAGRASVLQSGGLYLPARVPEGPDRIHDAEGDRAADVRPASPAYKYANIPFDPTQSFHATHVAGIAAGEPTVVAGQTISGVAPQAYLGNYKALTIPTPDFGPRRQQRRDRRGDRCRGRRRHERDQPLARRARSRADAATSSSPRSTAPQPQVSCRWSPPATTSEASATARSPRRVMRPGAITVAAVTRRGVIADFSSAGPTPVSLGMKPDVAAPGVGVLSSLPASQGTVRASQRDEHGDATCRRRRRAAQGAAPDVDRPADQVGADADGRPGTHREPAREPLSIREGGGIVDLPRADTPLLFATPDRPLVRQPRAGATNAVTVSTLADAGGGAGDWVVDDRVQTGGGHVSVPAPVTVPGSAAVDGDRGHDAGDVTRFRRADARHRRSADSVLVRRRRRRRSPGRGRC